MKPLRRIPMLLAAGTAAAATLLAAGPAQAAAGTYSLLILPDQGETQIYNFVDSATSSIDMTMYELKDTTLDNDLIARHNAGVNVRVILDQAQMSYDQGAYNALTAAGISVVWSSTSFTYTHQKTITVDNKESYITTGNLDTTYYSTSRDYGVFDTDANDVAAVVAVFNADFAHTSITPSDGDDLVWSPTDSQTRLLALINGAQHSLDIEEEEFSDTPLVDAIVSAAQRGVTVRLVLENESNDYASEISQVEAVGAKVTTYTSPTGFYIHAKAIVADYGTSTAKAFQGSENFSSNSLNNNRELGLIVSDAGVVSGLESTFTADFNDTSSSVVSVTNPGSQTSTVGTAASLQISATDTASSTLSYSATGLPTGLAINASSGLISGTPTTAGTYSVTVKATDGNGASGSTSFTWTVNPATTGNTVTVANPGNQTGTAGTAASLQISATDSASGQTLTYSATGLPAGLTINTSSGLISGTPTTAGTSDVTVTATDTTGAAGHASFTWTVNPVSTGNTVTVTNPGNQTGTAGTAASLQISATDSASGQTLTYGAKALPAGLTINSATGLISGTPTTAGSYSTIVTATDTTGASGSVSFTWTINPATTGDTVTVTNPGNQTGAVGTAASLQISATDSASGQTLTYSATGLPAGLSINTSTGLISGTPTTAGTDSVTVTATDTTGASGTASFTWTVNAASACSAAQLLGNPGFENGSSNPAPWAVTSTHTPDDVINSSSSEPPHSGTWDAWLDGWGTTTTDTLAQTITLPSGCSTYQFSYWLHIDTAETTKSTAYDTLTVQVLNSSGTVLGTVATYSNLNAATGYTQHSFSLSAYAGQTVTLKFTGAEDYEKQTSFVVDDTAVNVS